MPEKEFSCYSETANLAKQFGTIETKPNIYKNAKLRLRDIGKIRGFTPAREYFFKESGETQQWRKVSIIWKSPKGVAAAFDIKSKAGNLKDIEDLPRMVKLLDFPAEKKYVVNVSRETGQAYFIEVTKESIEHHRLRAPTISTIKAYSVEEIRRYHKNAFKRWSESEDSELKDGFNQGLNLEELAQKHQRGIGGIFSRLIKIGLISEMTIFDPKLTKNASVESSGNLIPPFTLLVKSQKNNKFCLAFVDNNNTNRWIRPIKAGGFDEKDIIMDNGVPIELFDVVHLNLIPASLPNPVNRYKENIKYEAGKSIKFVRKLSKIERELLVSRMANRKLIGDISSKEQIFEKMSSILGQSLIMAGPIDRFGIELGRDENHPRIWITKDNNHFCSLPCTDIQFFNFIKSKIKDSQNYNTILDSDKFPEFRERRVYLVIGLTGDSLDENEQVKDGKWHERYWPLVVSVITVPQYLEQS